MEEKFKNVFLTTVKVADNDFFNDKRLDEWKDFITKKAFNICEGIMDLIDISMDINYFISYTHIKEVIRDAVIGMKKIVYGTSHEVETPNAFKIIAYLSYWFMRHKPVSIIYDENVDLDAIELKNPLIELSADEVSWKLKHINEVIAVDIVTSYLFDFNHIVCNKKQCERVVKANIRNLKVGENIINEKLFDFGDFNELRSIMINKLTYYFTYRAIAPKVIEHILEGYTFHPAWGLTGAHWKTEEKNI